MMKRADPIAMARNLMCMALVCLDEAGERKASVRQQAAIKALREASILKADEILHDDMVDSQLDRHLESTKID